MFLSQRALRRERELRKLAIGERDKERVWSDSLCKRGDVLAAELERVRGLSIEHIHQNARLRIALAKWDRWADKMPDQVAEEDEIVGAEGGAL